MGVLVTLAAAVLAGLCIRVDCLVVEAPAGQLRAVLPLGPPGGRDLSFSLSFRHSVAKLPVEDFFRPVDGRLQLYRTVYSGLGAGLPFGDEGGTVSLVDGSIVIDGLDRRMERLAVSPSSFTENRLTVWGRRYDFFRLIGGGGIAILAVDRRPLLAVIFPRPGTKGEPE